MKTNQIRSALFPYLLGFTLFGLPRWNAQAQTHLVQPATFTPETGTNFAFGSVPIGHVIQKIFTFMNTGTDTLFIESLELNADSAFTIQFATLTIPPEQSGQVVVQFAPDSARTVSGTIGFDLGSAASSPTLVLSGEGVPRIANIGSLLTTGIPVQNHSKAR